MKNATLLTFLVASFVVVPAQAAKAEEAGKFSVETGVDYNTGRYGGSRPTSILYIPVTGKYQEKSWTMRLTVPYLQVTGPASMINVLNGVNLAAGAYTNNPVTRSGLGDVVMAVTHNTYYDSSTGFMFNLSGKIKFGTASRAKGLGTGENDKAVQSELYLVSEKQTTFGTLGYKMYESPAGAGYKLINGYYGSLGSSYKFDSEVNGGAMLSLSQKITATGSAHTEAILFASYKLDKKWKARGYVLKGLTKSVPDWGFGATIAQNL